MSDKTRGNALFMILIAIFLLGAVTALIARTSSTSEETGITENRSIKAGEIVEYLTQVQGGVQKMLLNGCSENTLSFVNSTYYYSGGSLVSTAGNYPNAPADESCNLFSAKGGGVSPKLFNPKKFGKPGYNAAYDTYGTLALEFITAIIPGLGSNKSELLVMLGDLDMDICNEVNKRIGIGLYDGTEPAYDLNPTTGYAPPGVEGSDSHYDNNQFTEKDSSNTALDPFNDDLYGRKMFCAVNADRASSAKDWSRAYAVLIVR